MNNNLGLIGKKLGNTQIFMEDGEVRRVTVVETGPCVVLEKRTEEKNGYTALVLGFGEKRLKSVNQPEAGYFGKVEQKPAAKVAEIRVTAETADKFEVGQVIKASDVFEEDTYVDVTGTSKGRGYTGVMKRHNFAGYKATHGQHEYQRHGGSIGMNMTPGRTFKGKRMAGQHGNARVTNQNLKVARVMDEEGLVLVEGSVPGPKGGLVTLRHSVKKAGKRVQR